MCSELIRLAGGTCSKRPFPSEKLNFSGVSLPLLRNRCNNTDARKVQRLFGEHFSTRLIPSFPSGIPITFSICESTVLRAGRLMAEGPGQQAGALPCKFSIEE